MGVLLDIQLPVKSGWEVMEELKSNAMTRHIPVHIMSSHKLRQESMLKGAVNFLDKPVAYEQIPEVFRRIEHIVNQESQKVLIIEDNSKHAEALSFFLENNNIRSQISSDISKGVETLQKDGVNCVILDMGIPDKQAYDLLEGMKKSGRTRKYSGDCIYGEKPVAHRRDENQEIRRLDYCQNGTLLPTHARRSVVVPAHRGGKESQWQT
jgi:CheY-like chemotaxis protein